jgi:hypothetical protein
MKHQLDAGTRRAADGRVPQIPNEQLQVAPKMRQIRLETRGQVVHDPNGVPLSDEALGDVRPDEAGSAGNQTGLRSHQGLSR